MSAFEAPTGPLVPPWPPASPWPIPDLCLTPASLLAPGSDACQCLLCLSLQLTEASAYLSVTQQQSIVMPMQNSPLTCHSQLLLFLPCPLALPLDHMNHSCPFPYAVSTAIGCPSFCTSQLIHAFPAPTPNPQSPPPTPLPEDWTIPAVFPADIRHD